MTVLIDHRHRHARANRLLLAHRKRSAAQKKQSSRNPPGAAKSHPKFKPEPPQNAPHRRQYSPGRFVTNHMW